jgi:hypothetical protein
MLLIAVLTAMSLYPQSTAIAGPPPPSPSALPTIKPTAVWEAPEIRAEVEEGRERGELSRRQAKELRRELRQIATLEERYAAGGISEAEQEELRARVEMVRALTRAKRTGALK